MNVTPSQFDSFLNAYIKCALGSSADESDEHGGRPLDENFSPSDLSPEALKAMTDDCEKFLDTHRDTVIESGLTLAEAGFCFWLNRNRHGSGFWDRDITDTYQDELDTASKRFGKCDLYVGDDGLVYLA